MRLTILNQFYKPDLSPTATLSASLAEHRAARGDQVTIIAGKGGYTGGEASGAPADETRTGGGNIRILRVWTPGLGKASHLKRVIDYAAFYLFAIIRILLLPRQDVIITLTTPPLIAWAALLHKRLRGGRTKLILWNMDCYPDLAVRSGVLKPRGLVTRLSQSLNRAIFRKLNHLVCLDNAMAHLLCEQYAPCNPALPVTIIPNWEDGSLFPPNPDHPAWPGWKDLDAEGKFVILYLGNMGYGHTFSAVLDAAQTLKEDPVKFVFIGGGKRAAEVEEQARARNLHNIIVRGYVPKAETPSLMTGASCALVTLRDEIKGIMSPSKIHSNLAMGLPLVYVGPRGTNVDDAIAAHNCGISLRENETDALVSFIRRMIKEPAELAALRRRARAAFEQAYCDAATLPRFDAVINHALTGAAAVPDIPGGDAASYASPRPAPSAHGASTHAPAPAPALQDAAT